MNWFLKALLGYFILASSAASVYAQTRVVVIPMSADNPEPLANIITVATNNGDFSDPIAAVNSISDASVNNPYLIVIAPGVYSLAETLNMRPWVDIAGSGQGVTRLTAAISQPGADSNASVLSINQPNTNLRDLTVENTGGVNPYSYGITVFGNVAPRISNVTVRVSGQSQQAGIWTNNSSPLIADSMIEVSNGASPQWGLYLSGGAPEISGTTVRVSDGGTVQTGIVTYSNSKVAIAGTTVRVSGGSSNQRGIYMLQQTGSFNISDSSVTILGGNGSQIGIRFTTNSGEASRISNTSIELLDGISTQRGLTKSGTIQDTISDSRITISGTGAQYGVNISSTLIISDVSIALSDGSTQYGVSNTSNSAYAIIRGSRISAGTNSIAARNGINSNETYISDSILTGPISGNPRCSFVFMSTGEAPTDACLPPP